MKRLLKSGCFCVVFACISLGSCLSSVVAAASEWVVTDQSRIRLISETEGIGRGDSLRIGLQIQLAPGWKTYWRSPGDAGIPPRLDWEGSENLRSAEILWPLPEQFEAYGFSGWGYHDEVVFPIDITLKEAGKPLDLKLNLQLGICEDVCIPYTHELTLLLDKKSEGLTKEAKIIEKFVRRVPEKIGSDNAILTAVTARSEGRARFSVTVGSSQPMEKPSIIVEGQDGAYFDLISSTLTEDSEQAVFEMEGHLPDKSDQISGQNITVTIFDRNISGEKQIRIE